MNDFLFSLISIWKEWIIHEHVLAVNFTYLNNIAREYLVLVSACVSPTVILCVCICEYVQDAARAWQHFLFPLHIP